jgi:O-antigen/teichoic acid export membrane protein
MSLLNRMNYGVLLSLAKLAAGLVKVKALAVLLGAGGIGVYSLGMQLHSMLVACISLSLAVGVINLGRGHAVSGDHRRLGEVLGTAISILVVSTLFWGVTFLIIVFGGYSSAIGVISSGDWLVLWVLLVSAVLVSLANVLGEGLCFVLDRYDLYVWVNIAVAVVDAACFLVGAIVGGVKGAICAALFVAVGQLLLYACILWSQERVRILLKQLSCKQFLIPELMKYCLLMLFSTGLSAGCVFFARATVVDVVGGRWNGILQVVTAFAAYFMAFIMNGVWGYLHPKVAAIGDKPEARKELERVFGLCLMAVVCGMLLLSCVMPLFIRIFYTENFIDALTLVNPYFIGEIFFLMSSVVGAYFLATGKKWAYLVGVVAYHAVLLVGVILWVDSMGVWAYVVAHIVGGCLTYTVLFVYASATRLFPKRVLLHATGLMLTGVSILLLDWSDASVKFDGVVLPLSWLGALLIAFLLFRHLFVRRRG